MPEQLWFTAFLNHYLAGPATALLRALHVEPKFPDAPITNSVSMELLVFLFLVVLFAYRSATTFPGVVIVLIGVPVYALFQRFGRRVKRPALQGRREKSMRA